MLNFRWVLIFKPKWHSKLRCSALSNTHPFARLHETTAVDTCLQLLADCLTQLECQESKKANSLSLEKPEITSSFWFHPNGFGGFPTVLLGYQHLLSGFADGWPPTVPLNNVPRRSGRHDKCQLSQKGKAIARPGKPQAHPPAISGGHWFGNIGFGC